MHIYILMGNSSRSSPKHLKVLKTKAFFSQVHFRVDNKAPCYLTSTSCPSQHSPCVQNICWMKKWLSCPPKSLWTTIKNWKTKTVFLTVSPPPNFQKQNNPSKQTEGFNLDLWDPAQGPQLELRFQLWLTKATSGARERLSQDVSVVGGCDGHPKPWNTIAWLASLLAFDNSLSSEYTSLSRHFFSPDKYLLN